MELSEIRAAYADYVGRLAPFREKIKEDRRWFEQTQTELQGKEEKKKAPGVPNSHSGHIFNAIQYKHADAMDNFPCANVLPREESDEEGAKLLTEIVPFVLERCKFRKTYRLNTYDKLGPGTAAYGVFWDDGASDVCVKAIDLLNFLWQPDAVSLQDSRYVFYDSFMPKDDFVNVYGSIEGCAMQSSHYEPKENTGTEVADTVVITDCYYKVQVDEKKRVLHFVKFSGDKVLFSSEDTAGYEDGFYKHGRFPFCFDLLHPVSGKIYGMGIVDVAKHMQARIDKLDAAITRHAVKCAQSRYLGKKNSGINAAEFMNLDTEYIEAQGDLNDAIRQIEVSTMPSFVMNHRDKLIEELKEICGNRDFAQGGSSGGVTAASAITALQTASDKLVRDSVGFSYECFAEIVELIIELIREFYTEEKVFRVTGDDGRSVFKKVKNSDIFGESQAAVFDVTVTVEKSNPYTRAMHNSLILELAQAGLLNPQNFVVNKFILSQLNFDGKDKLIQDLEKLHNEINRPAPTPKTGDSGTGSEVTIPGADGSPMVEIPIGDSGAMGAVVDPMIEIPVG